MAPKLSETEKSVIAGGFSGCIAKTITAPLSRLTILSQVQSIVSSTRVESFYGSFVRIVKDEGFLSLWKGNLASVIHRFPYSAINFAGYEVCRGFICKAFKIDESPGVRLASGAVAGAIACTACYPLDLVRTRLSLKCSGSYSGILDALYRVYIEEGVSGLYRGLGVSLLVAVPSIALSYGVYGTLKFWIVEQRRPGTEVFRDNKGRLSMGGALLCGSLSGIVASLCIFPLDLLRRRLHLQGVRVIDSSTGYETKVVSSTGTLTKQVLDVIRVEGVIGLYRGIIPELLKISPMVGITFCSYEILAELLGMKSHV